MALTKWTEADALWLQVDLPTQLVQVGLAKYQDAFKVFGKGLKVTGTQSLGNEA